LLEGAGPLHLLHWNAGTVSTRILAQPDTPTSVVADPSFALILADPTPTARTTPSGEMVATIVSLEEKTGSHGISTCRPLASNAVTVRSRHSWT
jgi:hypothetical protein